jgi:hypothetical protein
MVEAVMDYNKSMGDVVIPEIKVIRLMNRPCYMKLDPVHWGKTAWTDVRPMECVEFAAAADLQEGAASYVVMTT